MSKAFRHLMTFVAGSFAGLLAAQALVATMARNGGSPGGELLILPAIPLMLWCGYSFGRDAQQYRAYRNGYQRGYHEAQHDQEGGSPDARQPTPAVMASLIEEGWSL